MPAGKEKAVKRLSVSLIALLAALPATAQQTDITLDEIVVTANRTETEASRTGASFSKLDQTEIQSQPGQSAVQLLSQLPSVALRTNGPVGTQVGITVRGVPQTSIGVRVDGIDVTDPSGTQVAFDFGQLTAFDLSAVELVRGGQSALYGSRTVGGALEFTTRRPTEEGLSQDILAEGGAYGTRKLSYGLSYKEGVNELAFTLSRIETDGFSAADEDNGNTEADGYEADRLSFYAATEFQNGLRLSFNGFLESSLAEYDEEAGGVVSDGTPDELIDRATWGLRSVAEFSTGAVDHQVAVSRFSIDRVLTGTNGFGAFRFAYVGERDTLSYRGKSDLSPATTLVFGAETSEERYRDDISGGGAQSLKTGIDAAYAELSYSPGNDLDVVLSARHDVHSRFGGFTTGRLSVNWRPTEETTVRFNLGNGFRAPSNYELFDAFAGNAGLQPETSVSYDIGVERDLANRGKLSITYFDVTTKNLIDYSFASFTYVQRAGEARRRGVEVSGDWELADGMTLTGAYTYTDARTTAVLDSSAWSANTPQHAIAVGVGADITSEARLDATALFVAGRANLPDYAVVNATFSYNINEQAAVYLRADNLLDENYQTVPGYGTSRRALYAGIRASF